MAVEIFKKIMFFSGDKIVDLWLLIEFVIAIILYARYDFLQFFSVSKTLEHLASDNKIGGKAKECPVLSNLWKKYMQSLDASNIQQSILIEDYFGEYALKKAFRRNISETVPLLIAALSIAAAFINMAQGLYKLQNLSSNQASMGTFSGVGIESIAIVMGGILISLLYFIADRTYYNFILKKIDIFKESLIQSSISLKDNPTEMLDSKLLFMVETMQLFKDTVAKLDHNISEAVLSFKQEALKELTDSFANSISLSFEKNHTRLNELMTELSQTQERALSSMNTLYSTLESAVEKQTGINEKTDALITSFDNHAQTINTLVPDLSNIFSQFSVITSTVLTDYDKGMSDTAEKLSQTIHSMLQNMDEKLYAVSLYSTHLSEDIKRLTDILENSIEQFNEHIVDSAKTTFTIFDQSMADIAQRLGNTAEAIRDSVEELPSLMITIKKDFEEAR